MKALFKLDEVIAIDANHRLIATFTLADDEDWDEIPPIVAQKCPDCGDMVEDFEQHDCCRK